MDRSEALALMEEWTPSDALRRHMLGVEAVMRHYARKLGEDEELWGLAGLLHDFDYERHPQVPDHPLEGAKVLRAKGCPEIIVKAILAHAPATGVLFAVDELVGFLFACAYVQPTKKIADVKVSSVKKKLKDKAFARAVSREDIALGIEELGVDADAHIAAVAGALAASAGFIGLAGSEGSPGA
jgi:putative nucleotidyltransferase with HDIG domain